MLLAATNLETINSEMVNDECINRDDHQGSVWLSDYIYVKARQLGKAFPLHKKGSWCVLSDIAGLKSINDSGQ